MNEVKLSGKSIDLQPMSLDFVTSRYLNWLRDPDVTQALYAIHLSEAELKEYVTKRMRDPNSRFWAIVDRKSGEHIGNIKLEPIDWNTKISNFGIMIGEKKFWGKGLATEATTLVARHGIDDLKLVKIELGVFADNTGALNAYLKSGFKIESTVKNYEVKNGVSHDLVKMAYR